MWLGGRKMPRSAVGNSIYNFLECKNQINKDIFFISLKHVQPRNLQLLLYERNNLSDDDNIKIFICLHKFIKQTHRFD